MPCIWKKRNTSIKLTNVELITAPVPLCGRQVALPGWSSTMESPGADLVCWAVSDNSTTFCFLILYLFWRFKECFRHVFLRPLQTSDLKHVTHNPNIKFTFLNFDLVNSDTLPWHEVTKSLEVFFGSIPDMVNAVSLALFQPDMVFWPARPAMVNNNKNLILDLTRDVVNDLHIEFLNTFANFMLGAIKCHSRTENKSCCLADSRSQARGGDESPLPNRGESP